MQAIARVNRVDEKAGNGPIKTRRRSHIRTSFLLRTAVAP